MIHPPAHRARPSERLITFGGKGTEELNMQENSILIPRTSRRALAAWLQDEGFERPQNIHPKIWRDLLHAEIVMLDFTLLGELCDVLSPAILDVIRWPNARNWPELAGPAGALR